MMASNSDDNQKLAFALLMPAVDSLIHPPVIPESRRRESPVIIDVDAFDADDIVYVGSAGPSQTRHVEEDEGAVTVTSEVIHVSDSEDDSEIQFVGHNPARPQPPLVRRARIFSPPPPPQIAAIPPVPQVPQRFLRQRPAAGLVIPNEDPFPFEAELRLLPSAEQPFPVAAAPSHHVPAMGFGGALIAGVRRFMGPRNTPQRPERRNNWGVSGSFIMRWDAFEVAGGEEEAVFDGLGEAGFLGDDDNAFAAGRVRDQIERAFRQRGREARVEPDYQPEYTHPDPPSPGFTHDFSPSSSASSVAEADTSALHRASGSGTRLCEATLICAACRDPLVLGASDVGEDRAKRKIWGLRCGHLLDGKCFEKLIEPLPPTPEVGSSSTRLMVTEPGEYPPSQDMVAVGPDAGSMRSRLRPRRGMSGSVSSVRHLVPATPISGRHAPLRAQPSNRSNRKGKGKMKAPVIDAEYEWKCPVSGCERVHLSLLMDGRWTTDEKRGAVAVFV